MERFESAPAKINLTLHITGQRDDGYHLLDSLVMFANVSDNLIMYANEPTKLTVEGREADGVPTDHTNSILSIAHSMIPVGQSARFLLNKQLPTAAGIGGGTADAAAAFRLVVREWPEASPTSAPFNHDEPNDSIRTALCNWAAHFGADVPVCLFSRTARVQGIGERISAMPKLPRLHALLVNPRVAVPTPEIFSRITQKNNPPMVGLKDFADAATLIAWLKTQRNDMQDAAIFVAPVIQTVLEMLDKQAGCRLARMSGSGATCFGLFTNEDDAFAASAEINTLYPEWWSDVCVLGDDAD